MHCRLLSRSGSRPKGTLDVQASRIRQTGSEFEAAVFAVTLRAHPGRSGKVLELGDNDFGEIDRKATRADLVLRQSLMPAALVIMPITIGLALITTDALTLTVAAAAS
jgi:hypothetical protein